MLFYARPNNSSTISNSIHVNNSSGVVLQIRPGLFQVTACAVLMMSVILSKLHPVQTPSQMSLVVIQ